jgi:hypothetical protein
LLGRHAADIRRRFVLLGLGTTTSASTASTAARTFGRNLFADRRDGCLALRTAQLDLRSRRRRTGPGFGGVFRMFVLPLLGGRLGGVLVVGMLLAFLGAFLLTVVGFRFRRLATSGCRVRAMRRRGGLLSRGLGGPAATACATTVG